MEVERCPVYKIARNQRDVLVLLGISMYILFKLIGCICNIFRFWEPRFVMSDKEQCELFLVHSEGHNFTFKMI